jgi:hypothetical protein
MAASVAVLGVTQFAIYSHFAQTVNHSDGDAPPVKFLLLL